MNPIYRKGYEQAARDIFDSLENSMESYSSKHDGFMAIDVAMSYAREALKHDPFKLGEGYKKKENKS